VDGLIGLGNDNHQVVVAVLVSFAPGTRAKEVDALRGKRLDEPPNQLSQDGIGSEDPFWLP
jgi:hypothetical protein